MEFDGLEPSDCPQTSSALDAVPDVRLVEPGGNALQEALHDLYSQARRFGRREDVKGLIVDLLPNLKDIEILTEGENPVLYFVYEDTAVPAALAGDGIHALVRVALELASRPEGVVLLEEPEVHQHPGAIRQSVRAILAAVRRDVQVILTTHSLELIDALVAESSPDDLQRLSLYQLELDNGKLISVRKPGPEVAFSRGEIEEDLR
jgi:predicted ATPase